MRDFIRDSLASEAWHLMKWFDPVPRHVVHVAHLASQPAASIAAHTRLSSRDNLILVTVALIHDID